MVIATTQDASGGTRLFKKLSTSPVRICALPVYGFRRLVNFEASSAAGGSAFASIAKNAAANSRNFSLDGLRSGEKSPSGWR